jgi:hypothetical protein
LPSLRQDERGLVSHRLMLMARQQTPPAAEEQKDGKPAEADESHTLLSQPSPDF